MNRFAITLENKEDIGYYAKNGVDELIVYLKGYCFSGLKQFVMEDVLAIIGDARAYGMDVSVSMNRLFFPHETKKAAEIMAKIICAGAYVQFSDPALLRHALQNGLAAGMIYQPEMLVTNRCDADNWMDTGIHSVVISPLLTAEEIRDIAMHVSHTRLQIHGHSLMSMSGRKLLHAFTRETGIPAEKDLYLQEEKRDGKMPVFEDQNGTYIYTDYVLHSFMHMPYLKDVETLEISTLGMDREEAVFAMQLYRKIQNGMDGQEALELYRNRYPETVLFSGYYDEKTIR